MTASKEERVAKVIEILNTARAMELYVIHQYMDQHYFLDDADYGKLAKPIKKIAIEEMRHAEHLAERLKDLNGEPCHKLASQVVRAKTVDDIFGFDADIEANTIDKYSEFAQICREQGDQVTANLFNRLADIEQEHHDYFDDVNNHIKELRESYLAKMISDAE